jgi:hypothetical protein
MDYFNSNIIQRHDEHMTLNNWMVDHFSFMMGLSFITEAEHDLYAEEKATYLCYDV